MPESKLSLLRVLLAMSLAVSACDPSKDPSRENAAAVSGGREEATVAVVWPWKSRPDIMFEHGLRLALSEVGSKEGSIAKRLNVLKVDDREAVTEGLIVAEGVAANPRVVAVIGHLQSYVTVPAAALYDLAEKILIAPTSTDVRLTSNGYDRVFRMTFTDQDIGRRMAEYASDHGYCRIAIYYVRNQYGRALANAFEEKALGLGVDVIQRASYIAESQSPRGFENTFGQWVGLDLDAIFLAGQVPEAGYIIAALRREGIAAPVLGSDAMGAKSLLSIGGRAAEGTVVPMAFHPGQDRPEVRRFVERFRARYGLPPDVGAALAYDAIHLLARAMEEAGDTHPSEIAKALHGLNQWRGVTGAVTFDPSGNLLSPDIILSVVKEGSFSYSPSSNEPVGCES